MVGDWHPLPLSGVKPQYRIRGQTINNVLSYGTKTNLCQLHQNCRKSKKQGYYTCVKYRWNSCIGDWHKMSMCRVHSIPQVPVKTMHRWFTWFGYFITIINIITTTNSALSPTTGNDTAIVRACAKILSHRAVFSGDLDIIKIIFSILL